MEGALAGKAYCEPSFPRRLSVREQLVNRKTHISDELVKIERALAILDSNKQMEELYDVLREVF